MGLFDGVDPKSVVITHKDGKDTAPPDQPEQQPTPQPDNQTPPAQPEQAPQPADQTPPPENPGSVPDIAQVTQGQFNSVEELYTKYRELQSTPPQSGQEEMDEFIRGAVDYYKATGDLTPYLEAKTVDYSNLDDMAVLKRSFMGQHKHLPAETAERLFQKHLRDKYYQDPDKYSEEDVSLGKDILAAEAAQARQKLIEEQSKFKAPERQQQQTAYDYEAEMQQLRQRPEIQNLMVNRMIPVKYGDQSFNFEVSDPDKLVGTAADVANFFKLFESAPGQYDLGKWMKVAAYAADPEAFEKNLITFGKNLGVDGIITNRQNPPPVEPGNPGEPAGTPKEQFLRKAIASKRTG